MKKTNISLIIIFLIVFFNSYAHEISLFPRNPNYPSSALEDTTTELPTFANSLNLFSENEDISMLLPNNSLTETHYLSSNEGTCVITLSYGDDIVYIILIDKKTEDKDEEDTCNGNEEVEAANDLVISGIPCKHSIIDLNETASKEFLYGWTGETFANQIINKYTSLELHLFQLESLDYNIFMVVCGPNNQDVEKAALKYVEALQVRILYPR